MVHKNPLAAQCKTSLRQEHSPGTHGKPQLNLPLNFHNSYGDKLIQSSQ